MDHHEEIDEGLVSPEYTPRRLTRNRTKPKKYDGFLDMTPVKRKNYELVESSDEELQDSTSKPKALFGNDDVDGQDIFKFKSRHTKNDLHNKAKAAVSNSLNSPLKTPRKSLLHKVSEATPKHVVNIMKNKIIQAVDSNSSDSDFSGCSSDFVPDKSGDESGSTSSGTGTDSEGEEEMSSNKKGNVPISKTRNNKMRPKDTEYFVTPDNYFMMNSSKKITTSDHTLARLKMMNINENIKEVEVHVSELHRDKVGDLVQTYDQLFDRWLYVLSENFNIILYGIGSKRAVLQRFQAEKLQDTPCIVVNGFFPSLTIKNILEAIIIDFLENTHIPSNVGDVMSLIDAQLDELNVDLFLIVHNIDGSTLRNSKAQSVLASLAQLRNVHMIATIDHINAPLLWDHCKLSKYNWAWWDATTFAPYAAETAFESTLLTQRSAALQLASLASVFRSLTANAKGIFLIIIRHQLDNQKQAHYQGLPFKDLYSKTREQFLVSSDLALRAQLTEFLDHKLVKIKRTYDGSENLVIPIESSLLQQFLDQQSTVQ